MTAAGARAWAAGHPRAVAALAAALALAVAGSVARCSAVHAPSLAGEGAAASPEDEADALLAGPQRSLRDGYGDAERGVVALLSANVWVPAGEGRAVTFTDHAIRERAGDGDVWTAYVVAATATTTVGGSRVTSACLVTPGWTDMATIEEGGEATTLACPRIASGARLVLSAAGKSVRIDGPGNEWLDAHGTSREEVEAALTEWCAANAPTASAASWTEVAEEDYGTGVTRLRYALDGLSAARATVSIGMGGGDVAVGRG